MSEDEILGLVADHCRSADFLVLAESASQGSAFRFIIGARSKAPDFVAIKRRILIVAECKTRSGDLFRSYRGELSDFDSMAFLARSISSQQQLIREASVRMSSLGLQADRAGVTVYATMISLGSLAKHEAKALAGNIALLAVNPHEERLLAFSGCNATILDAAVRS